MTKYVKSNATFIAALITQAIIVVVWWMDVMPYLWLNLVGCALVMFIALILQTMQKKGSDTTEASAS